MGYRELFFGLGSQSKMRLGRLGGSKIVSRGTISGGRLLVSKRERSGKRARSRLSGKSLEILSGFLAQVLREVLEVSTSTTIGPTLSLLMIRRRMRPLQQRLREKRRR